MKFVFLTGTRADFGKIKPLIEVCENLQGIDCYLFVTGMHMLKRFGSTFHEIEKCQFSNIFKFFNSREEDSMEMSLSKTIEGFSFYVEELEPDYIVVHGDRVEALAGAIVGSLKNIRVIHIEGGEISGTIDESIRHAITKLAHLHLVSNNTAKERLKLLGENEKFIQVIGSPDLDVMFSERLPPLESVLNHYNITFDEYTIFMYHPVTTEVKRLSEKITQLEKIFNITSMNFIIIYPNNDLGSELLINFYDKLKGKKNIKIYPSINFESFLTLLKNCKMIIGNSSAGIREAPAYNIPTVNIGTRQQGRANENSIFNCCEDYNDIINAVKKASDYKPTSEKLKESFGNGESTKLFRELIIKGFFNTAPIQKKLTYDL